MKKNLVLYIENTKESLIDLYRSKQEMGYHRTGDWDGYLANKVSAIKPIKKMGFFVDDINEIYAKLGIDSKKLYQLL